MTQYETFSGLTEKQAKESAEKHGYNTITRQKRHSFCRQFISSFNDPIIKILLGALLANSLFWIREFNPYEALGIVGAILLSTFISALSEYGSEGAFLSLLEESEKSTCAVIRDGKIRKIPHQQLVCGDIVLLVAGEKLHADGVIVSGRVTVNQSALNGESKEVEKFPCKSTLTGDISSPNTLLGGCVVCEGEGLMQINEVGDKTFYGRLAGELQEKGAESPLKAKLAALARSVSKFGFISAFLVAAADLFNTAVIDKGYNKALILSFLNQPSSVLQAVLHAVTLALTVIIVSVPEGLPMMIGVVLSANIKRMKRDNVLVRKPVGIETAGSMDILFTDKTGTLTYGIPKLSHFILASGEMLTLNEFKKTALWEDFQLCAGLNTSCRMSADGIVGGNSTDRILFSYAERGAVSGWTVTENTPFSSDRKFSSCKARCKEKQRTFVKGASEAVLPKCTYGFDKSRKRTAVSEDFSKKVKQHALESARIITVAVSDKSGENMTLVCGIVLRDGLRREAKSAVTRLQNAKIGVVMITGDSPDTATAIAQDSGIITKKRKKVITGAELSALNDNEVKKLLPSLAAVARAYPSDKSRLVRICRECGMVVGMTGDGVNDAPALKRADVGFALGGGSDTAKEASDIVILDNNISSVCKAVLYGRTIFRSIRKFLTFQLTMNLCAVAVSLFAPLIGCETPVTVLQMLWINIIMDTLAALAFAGEIPREEYMKVPPTGRSEAVLSKSMISDIVYTGAIFIGTMIWYLTSDTTRMFFGGQGTAFYCGFFGLFVFSGIFNCFNVRTTRINLFSQMKQNKYFCFIILSITVVQLSLMYFGGNIFRCCPLPLKHLVFILSLSSLSIPCCCIKKLLKRKTV